MTRLSGQTPEAENVGQLTVLPVLLSGVLPYIEADGLALEAFMAAHGDPSRDDGGPSGDNGDQIWAADHVKVCCKHFKSSSFVIAMYISIWYQWCDTWCFDEHTSRCWQWHWGLQMVHVPTCTVRTDPL